MNRANYNEIKKLHEEFTQVLKKGHLSEEEKQHFEILQAQLSGQLLSIWLPFDWVRRSIMITLFLIGLYGLLKGATILLWTWLVLLFFSPRFVGEFCYFFGRVNRALK
jgi:hypothetical protein